MHLIRFAIVLLVITLTGYAQAQSSDKYLRKLPQEDFTLYFLSPTGFKDKKNKADLNVDFTFQYKKGLPQSVDMKFSVFTSSALQSLDSVSIHIEGQRLGRTSPVENMFLQKEKGKWHSRYNTTIPYRFLQQMLKASDEVVIRTHYTDHEFSFNAGKDWRSAGPIVQEILNAEIQN